MYNPIATYRLQFHKDFTFKNLEAIIPYLHQLGIRTIYASPITEAVAGSMHGYDGINPHRINPEIGTEEQLKMLNKVLQEYKIGWLQDIAPNHMAFHPGNAWLMDVLEKGKDSEYAAFFDILWNHKTSDSRLMVPFLGTSLREAINNGEINVVYEKGRFFLKYIDHCYPLKQGSPAIESNLSETVETFLEKINSNKTLLKQIADKQHYRLCHWQETNNKINYRRFFTVNSLICLNIQHPEVFDQYHKYIVSLLKENIFQGLRIDHIDGLYDPSNYLNKLRQLVGEECYLIVEKIVAKKETLPARWPVQGNTGYDFLYAVNNLFTQPDSKKDFTAFYERLIKDERSVHRQIAEKKAYILYHHMRGELENLYQLFKDLKLTNEQTCIDIGPERIKETIGELLIQCPVYRFYANKIPFEDKESNELQCLFNCIIEARPLLTSAVNMLQQVLLKNPLKQDKEYNQRALQFYQRCMQFSGPLMAKGVEDTLMYTYNRFIGHNEVGDAPDNHGISCEDFHYIMKERQKKQPLSLNATSTHDTKRGEDVRARLNVLTDLKEEWFEVVTAWYQLNSERQDKKVPDINDEYFIYQSLIGAYPMPGEATVDFKERFSAYLIKALREAKRNSNWEMPNEAYENTTKDFIMLLLDKSRPFWRSFEQFHKRIASFGIIYSLAQTVLKFTCPGVPDIYQGCELWDLRFVDPDNREPVDYVLRQQYLAALGNTDKVLLQEHWQHHYNAGIKLWIVNTLLKERTQHIALFNAGDYIPLKITGKYHQHILAFARRQKSAWFVVAVPLRLATLCKEQQKDIEMINWEDTSIILPLDAPDEWHHVLLNKTIRQLQQLNVQELFQIFPLAILR